MSRSFWFGNGHCRAAEAMIEGINTAGFPIRSAGGICTKAISRDYNSIRHLVQIMLGLEGVRKQPLPKIEETA